MATAYESSAWAQVKEGWRQLYGSFSREGVSVENHEFEATSALNWGRSFHRNSVELCLNLRGNGTVDDGRTQARYQPHTVGFYCNANADLKAERKKGEVHSFITVELSREYVESQVDSMEDELHPALRRWLINSGGSAANVGTMAPGMEVIFQAARPATRAAGGTEALVPGQDARAPLTNPFPAAPKGGVLLPAPEAGRPRA